MPNNAIPRGPRTRWFALTLLAALPGLGCSPSSPSTGGQSGSEGSYPLPCPCLLAQGKTALRAELTSVSGGCVTLEVREVLSAEANPDLAPGSIVGGAGDGTPACDGEANALTPGTEVLAFYSRGANDAGECVEYRECSAEQCGTVPTDDPDAMATWDACDEACLAETRDACAAHTSLAWLNGTVALVRWEETFTFGNYGTLPREELGLLTEESDSTCAERFTLAASEPPSGDEPTEPAPPPDEPAGGGVDSGTPACGTE